MCRGGGDGVGLKPEGPNKSKEQAFMKRGSIEAGPCILHTNFKREALV